MNNKIDLKVVLFLDVNMKDPRVGSGLNALVDFVKSTFTQYSILSPGKYEPNNIGIIWGIPSKHKVQRTLDRKKVHELQQQNKRPLLVIEVGFLKRNIYYSIGWNNIVGFGFYGFNHILEHNFPSDRFDQLNIKIKPNRLNHSGFILICGQVPWDTQLQHVNYKKWLYNIIQKIRKYTQRKIVYRPHPKQISTHRMAINTVPGTVLSTAKSLEEDFNNAFVVVAFNSNSLLEAMIEGLPFFSFDKGSVVHDIANHDLNCIENPSFPSDADKHQALANISYMQWNEQEIKEGKFWPYVIKYAEKSISIPKFITW